MRIPANEDNIKPLTNLLLDAKIVKLIEKLANYPLLIEKIIINDKASLQINLTQNSELKQLNIPIALSKELALITNDPANLKINITNNQIVVSITSLKPAPLNSTTTLQESEINKGLTLYFKQAHLINPQILKLTHHVIKSPLINESKLSGILEVNTTSKAVNSKLQTDAENGVSIKEAISHFLKTKPMDNSALSMSFNKLISLQNSLMTSLITPLKSLNQNELTNQIKNDNQFKNEISITKNELNEVLNKAISLLPKENIFSRLGSLNSKLDNLINSLDFSVHNKKLNLEQRIQNNGSFLESRLARFEPEKQLNQTDKNISADKPVPTQSTKQSGLTQNTSGKALEQKLPDIKLSILSLKQTLENLLKELGSPTEKPLVYSRIIQILSKHPAFVHLLTKNNSTNESQLLNTQVFTHLSDKLLANPANLPKATGSEFSNLVSGEELFKEIQHFKSTHLKNIFSNESSLMNAIKLNLNQKQQDALLSIQKHILREMLNETTAVINKVETNQLLSMRSETPLLQQFLIDLPIHHKDNFESFELLFESKNDNDDQPGKRWTITIRFDLEPLGPMFARVSLKNERISTHFFAKEPETTRLLQENIKHLKESLLVAGLDIDEITGQQGIVPKELLVNDELSVDLHA